MNHSPFLEECRNALVSIIASSVNLAQYVAGCIFFEDPVRFNPIVLFLVIGSIIYFVLQFIDSQKELSKFKDVDKDREFF